MTQTEPYPRTTELGHRMRPGTQPLGSPQLLHARAGVHVTNAIPAQRLSAGQDRPMRASVCVLSSVREELPCRSSADGINARWLPSRLSASRSSEVDKNVRLLFY